jgi:hypothetical protein
MKCGRLVFTGVGLLQTQCYKAANGSVGGEGGRTGEQEWSQSQKSDELVVGVLADS